VTEGKRERERERERERNTRVMGKSKSAVSSPVLERKSMWCVCVGREGGRGEKKREKCERE